MFPGAHALTTPEKAALVVARTGQVVSYSELNERSNRLAQLMWAEGLRPGDHIAILMENHPVYYDVVWAALRSGLLLTTINRYLSTEEAGYILHDCEAQVLISSMALADTAAGMPELAPNCRVRLLVDGEIEGFQSYEKSVANCSPAALADEPGGNFVLYSSGTTGKPKGIVRTLSDYQIAEGIPLKELYQGMWNYNPDMVYLSPAPLYHSAPIGFSSMVQSFGGTVVMMDRFDPVDALNYIERYQVTHSQWVPTMFTRFLKLPAEQREGFNLNSHQVAIHAAAPCPREVKQQMLAWWGPIICEYYGGTEVNGLTHVYAEEWLSHPGTVGRPILGVIHICDEEGEELPIGESGLVYFEMPEIPFVYLNDAERTRDSQHPRHRTWTALGDIGYVDAEGYLYLTDRASFMIISGGVNIYPQEIEDALIMHPKVADVAVIGVPNQEMGEEVKAVVQTMPGVVGSDELVLELIEFSKSTIAHFKCPKSIDFEDELPRLPTGKLYKRLLKDRYWANKDSGIV